MSPTSTSTGSNPFLLAADGSPALLPLLRSDPTLAAKQDASGYSLIHALASYDYVGLLRDLVAEFHPPIDLRDEDGETALFVAETVEVAQLLVEELGLDPLIENDEGQTAEQKIREEGDYVVVADYLAEVRKQKGEKTYDDETKQALEEEAAAASHPPPLPKGMTLNFGTMTEQEAGGEPDQEFRKRIEELALRDDFNAPEGQAELRALVKDAVRDIGAAEGKEARPRTE